VKLLGRADSTLRGMCGPAGAAGGTDIHVIAEAERMQQLREHGIVGRQCKQVASMSLAHVIKLCKHLGSMDALHADLTDKFKTAVAAPPIRHSPSTWGVPLLLSPLGPTQPTPGGGAAPQRQQVGRAVPPTPPPRARISMAASREHAQQDAPPPTQAPKKYIFPTTLPDVVLLPEQQSERYALQDQPGSLRREVQQFLDWSSAPINTERSGRYTRAVQSTTLDKVPGKIWGFLGYTAGFYNLGRQEISMQLYADPRFVARFVAYIKARDVGIGYIRAHLGLTRKVNDYLQSGAEDGSEVKLHASKMEKWLMTLEAQLTASIQRVVKAGAPDINVTWAWVEALCEGVLDQVDGELLRSDSISHATAMRVQEALVAALVTGCYCPPCRLYVLQTMIHPQFNDRIPCQDRDCMNGRGCMGNHLKLTTVDPPEGGSGWAEEPAGGSASNTNQNNNIGTVAPAYMWPYFDYDTTEVSNVIVHHKNDRYVWRMCMGIVWACGAALACYGAAYRLGRHTLTNQQPAPPTTTP